MRCGCIDLTAMELAQRVRQHGLMIITWHDLATLEEPFDEEGRSLNVTAFGWSDSELAPWRATDHALRSPLIRAARVASEPLWIGHTGIRSRHANRLLDEIDLLELEQDPWPRSAIVIPVHMPLGQIGAAILFSTNPQEQDLSARFNATIGNLTSDIQEFLSCYASICSATIKVRVARRSG